MNNATQPDTNPAGSKHAFHSVNPHCLEHIVALSQSHQVIADRDISDDKGVKLWAKGLPISQSLHEKLQRRRLSQPLESSLNVEGGISFAQIVEDTLSFIEEHPLVAAIAGNSDARGLLRDIQKLQLPGPAKLLLTSAREKQTASYQHSLAAMAICAGLASRLGLSPNESSMLIIAAMLHDIGEMYVNPQYLHDDKVLAPADWKNVAVHPCVGHAFIREFTNFPSAVAECVLHHHERLDGSGYPFQIMGQAIGRLGNIIAVADSASAIVIRGGESLRERIEVALRIVPEEFNRTTVSAINAALRAHPKDNGNNSPQDFASRITPVLERFAKARAVAESLTNGTQPANVEAVGNYVLAVLDNLHKSLRATGVYDPSQIAAINDDPLIKNEICLIVGEISWRLRNLARIVHLRMEKTGSSEELKQIAELIVALDPASASA